MPNADLRVVMRTVSVIPEERGVVTYTLPLVSPSDSKNALDRIDVSATVRPDAPSSGVINNFGLPVTQKGDAYRVAFSGIAYRPQKDFRVGWRAPDPSLYLSVYAARSGGPDGFFALALQPRVRLSHPSVRIDGPRTFDLTEPAPGGEKTLLPIAGDPHRKYNSR